ncbi:MAG: hypothetical protein WCD89_21840 [Anaerocolumna sp.]
MSKLKVLDYVDSVMAKIEVSEELKVQLENELIRHIIEASENTSIDDVKSSFFQPEKLADEITKKLVYRRRNDFNEPELSGNELDQMENYRRYHHRRIVGEFMSEQNRVNLKLLYIPLIQISSGTERITRPLFDDDDD